MAVPELHFRNTETAFLIPESKIQKPIPETGNLNESKNATFLGAARTCFALSSTSSTMAGNCPLNQAFYVCNINGFRGCCPFDPCNVSAGCQQPPVTAGDHVSSTQEGATERITTASLPSSTSPTATTIAPTTLPPAAIAPTTTLPKNDSMPQTQDANGSKVVPLAVGIGGGVVLIFVILAVGCFLRRQRRTRPSAQGCDQMQGKYRSITSHTIV